MTEVYMGPPSPKENKSDKATVVDVYHIYPTSQKEVRVENQVVKTEPPAKTK